MTLCALDGTPETPPSFGGVGWFLVLNFQREKKSLIFVPLTFLAVAAAAIAVEKLGKTSKLFWTEID